jgi:hypothetical protein
MPEAKAKAKRRRAQAVKDFKDWKLAHPRAKLERQVAVFDMLVDGGPLPPVVKRNKNATAL